MKLLVFSFTFFPIMKRKMFLILSLAFINMVTFPNYICVTIDDLPVMGERGCGNCEPVYAPVCASDNITYTNACRLNCINSKRLPADQATITRYGRCVLGYRKHNDKDGYYPFSDDQFNNSYSELLLKL